MNYHDAFMSILLNNFNAEGKIIDHDVCVEIAHFINMQPMTVPHFNIFHALWDFIREHGEDENWDYLGRDSEGEKMFHSHNPEENWHNRIRVELIKLGYYARWQEAQEAQKVLETV